MDTLRSNKMMFENNHAYQRGQEDQNKILADHFIYFLNIDVVLAHRGRSERHGQRHRRWPPTPGNCDHNAPHSSCRACDRIAGYVSAPFAIMDRMASFPARLVQWCGYWAKSAKMTIVGRNRTVAGDALGSGWKSIEKRLQMALLSAPWGPNSTTKEKSQKMVGKKII